MACEDENVGPGGYAAEVEVLEYAADLCFVPNDYVPPGVEFLMLWESGDKMLWESGDDMLWESD